MLKYLILSNLLFIIGVLGLCFTKKHIIVLLLSLELIFLSINYNFVISSIFFDDVIGQLYALCILTVAAAESAIGLAILVIFYRLRGGISLDIVNMLKG